MVRFIDVQGAGTCLDGERGEERLDPAIHNLFFLEEAYA
jgi:hypothetical protein